MKSTKKGIFLRQLAEGDRNLEPETTVQFTFSVSQTAAAELHHRLTSAELTGLKHVSRINGLKKNPYLGISPR